MTMEADAKREVSADGFLDNRLSILQPAKGARAGIEPVFLAACISAHEGERILDVGAGVGVASLCLGMRLKETRIWGLEIHPWLAELFTHNIVRNNLSRLARSVAGDLFSPMTQLQERGLATASFDHVLSNPPFSVPGDISVPANALRSLAHINPAGLDSWLGRCCSFLRPGGSLSVIYPASGIAELLAAVGTRLGGVRLFFLWAGKARMASRVICRGYLGSRAPLQVLPGMVLHEGNGDYTREAQSVLREGAEISLE